MTGTDQRTMWTAASSLLCKAVSYEVGMWCSLYRWMFRRPVASEAGAEAFGYATVLTPVLLVFIAVSAIEVPILHLLLPWETVRLTADLLGVWGLIWMFGLLAGLRVHPHVVSDSGLLIRYGITVDIAVPWDAVAAIRTRGRDLPGRTVQFDRTGPGVVLGVGVMKQTNIDIVFDRAIPVPLSGGNRESITELRCYADDPDAFVARARDHLAAAERRRIAG